MAELGRAVTKMASGAAAAQLLPLLLSPLLTRLYAPEALGIFNAIVAIATLFTILMTLRIELAIVPAASDDEGLLLAGTAFGLSCFMAGAMILGVLTAGDLLTSMFNFRGAVHWVYAAIALAWLVALTQIGSFLANRRERYGAIAASTVFQQGGYILIAVALGAFALGALGLVLARLASQVAASAWLVWQNGFFATVLPTVRRLSWRGIVRIAHQCRRYILFSVPYSFTGTVSRELLVLAFTAHSQAAAAGAYALARSVLLAPVGFLSSTLSQVYFREAVVREGNGTLGHLTLYLIAALAAISAPWYAWFAAYGEDAFALIFGESWRMAGTIAVLFTPIAWLSLFTSWPERIFETMQKQSWALAIQIIFDSLSIAGVLFSLASGGTALGAITLFVAIQGAYHLTYLATVCHLAGVSLLQLCRAMAIPVVASVAVFGSGLVLAKVTQLERSAIVIVGLLALLLSGIAVFRARRGWKLISLQEPPRSDAQP